MAGLLADHVPCPRSRPECGEDRESDFGGPRVAGKRGITLSGFFAGNDCENPQPAKIPAGGLGAWQQEKGMICESHGAHCFAPFRLATASGFSPGERGTQAYALAELRGLIKGPVEARGNDSPC